MEMSLGDKIRELREDLDLSQTQLGKELNMTQRKISYIECDKYEPSIEDIVAFCSFVLLPELYPPFKLSTSISTPCLVLIITQIFKNTTV